MCYLICLFLCVSLAVSHSFLSLFLGICPNVWFEDHLLSDTLVGHDSDSPDSLCTQNNNFHSCTLHGSAVCADPSLINPTLGLLEPPPLTTSSKSRLSLERSFSAEEDQQKCVECALQPARVYTITGESGMLGTSRGSKENLELEVLKGEQEACQAQALAQPSTSSNSSSPTQHHHHRGSGSGSGNHHHGIHHHSNTSGGGSSGPSGSNTQQHISGAGTSHHHHGVPHHHSHLSQPLQSSVSAHNIRGWGEGKECGLACEDCPGAPSHSQGFLDLESSTREAGKQRRPPLERMCSVDRMTGLERGERGRATGERKRERGSGWGEGVGFSQQRGRRCVRCAVVCIFPALLCLSPLSCVSLLCSLPLWSGPCVCVVAGGSSHSGPRKYLDA